jgi:HAE1 family hydrophobic/amphiphilic exporter-1
MTSFAFIFGLLPLWTASGAGSVARREMGTGVISGMIAATGIAIFIIPVLFVLVERLSGAEKRRREGEAAAPSSEHGAPVPAGGSH